MGIIAEKSPHVIEAEERNKVVKKSKMFIDVGVQTKKK